MSVITLQMIRIRARVAFTKNFPPVGNNDVINLSRRVVELYRNKKFLHKKLIVVFCDSILCSFVLKIGKIDLFYTILNMDKFLRRERSISSTDDDAPSTCSIVKQPFATNAENST